MDWKIKSTRFSNFQSIISSSVSSLLFSKWGRLIVIRKYRKRILFRVKIVMKTWFNDKIGFSIIIFGKTKTMCVSNLFFFCFRKFDSIFSKLWKWRMKLIMLAESKKINRRKCREGEEIEICCCRWQRHHFYFLCICVQKVWIFVILVWNRCVVLFYFFSWGAVDVNKCKRVFEKFGKIYGTRIKT